MSAMKKGTKLTDTPKDYMLRTRMDKETLRKLEDLSNELNLSKSEVVRISIEEKYRNMKK